MSLKGKQRTKKIGTRTYAKKHFNRNAIAELNLSDSYDRFLAYKWTRGLSRTTLRHYETHYGYFTGFLSETEGVKDLLHEEIITEVFTDYIRYMMERGLKPITINIRIRTMRAFLRWCYEEEYTDEAIHVKFKPVKVPGSQIEAFTPEEIRQLLNAIDTDTFVGFRDDVLILIRIYPSSSRTRRSSFSICFMNLGSNPFWFSSISLFTKAATVKNFTRLPKLCMAFKDINVAK